MRVLLAAAIVLAFISVASAIQICEKGKCKGPVVEFFEKDGKCKGDSEYYMFYEGLVPEGGKCNKVDTKRKDSALVALGASWKYSCGRNLVTRYYSTPDCSGPSTFEAAPTKKCFEINQDGEKSSARYLCASASTVPLSVGFLAILALLALCHL